MNDKPKPTCGVCGKELEQGQPVKQIGVRKGHTACMDEWWRTLGISDDEIKQTYLKPLATPTVRPEELMEP